MKYSLILLLFLSTLNAQFTDFEKEAIIYKSIKNNETFR